MDDFERWYRREHPRVLSTCAALTGELDAATDATDEGFARALERWATVSAMASPGGWVQVVALNHLRRALRRRSREQPGTSGSGPSNGAALDRGVPDPELWAVVVGLPPRQRTAVVLRYVHDLPEADIAAVMGIARGSVASTLAAAHLNLRRRVGDRDDPDDRAAPITTRKRSHR